MKRDIGSIAAVALLYFLFGRLSLALPLHNTIVTISVFFSEGIALAAVLLYGRRVWPGIFAGQLALALSFGMPLALSAAIAAVNSAEAVLAWHLFRFLGFDPRLNRLRHLLTLFWVVSLVLQPFSAVLGNLALMAGSVIGPADYFKSTFSWWFGNVMGQLLLTPLLLILHRDIRVFDLKVLTATVIFFGSFAYLLFFISPVNNLALLLTVTIPAVLLLATYAGPAYASFAILILTLGAILSVKFGTGPFSAGTQLDDIININFYILAHIMVVYSWGALSKEREDALSALSVLNRELEARVEAEVKKNREKDRLMLAQARLAQMGEAVNMIAHQWRQPLNTLSLLIQGVALKHRLNKFDEAAAGEFTRKSMHQIGEMSATVEDFRSFFRPGRERQPFELAPAVRHTYELVRPLFEHENIPVSLDLEEGICIDGYSNEFGQVLINLFKNARDAMPQRSVGSRGTITVTAALEDGVARILVEDTAGGIDESVLPKIFEPYFSTKTEKSGTGLGLYICRIIIEEHMQGRLYAENIPGGARFVIELNAERC